MAINASLMTLGRCLEALRWNQQHPDAEQRLVPYREARVRIQCCPPCTCLASGSRGGYVARMQIRALLQHLHTWCSTPLPFCWSPIFALQRDE